VAAAVATIVNVGVVLVVLLGVYWVFPVQDDIDFGWAVRLALGLLLTAGLIAWQVRAIKGAKRPLMRAVRALVASILLFLVIFSLTYLAIAHSRSSAFTEPLDKVSALYFSVTTLATVGYGDIAPVTHTARVVATVQMLLDIVVLAVTARLLFHTANAAVHRRKNEAESEVAEHRDR
jgi:voltage-gated potassium channel